MRLILYFGRPGRCAGLQQGLSRRNKRPRPLAQTEHKDEADHEHNHQADQALPGGHQRSEGPHRGRRAVNRLFPIRLDLSGQGDT